MSWKDIDNVIRKSQSGGNDKLVLIVIAHHINPKDGDCWPSLERIAEVSGLSRSTVARSIKHLESLGEIHKVTSSVIRSSQGWQKSSNHYSLPVAWNT